MIIVDTSVVVAGFASWHEHHAPARKVLAQDPQLVAHTAVETYSVLTRLPPPHRAQPAMVVRYLRSFATPLLTLSDEQHRELVERLGVVPIHGGQVYDALIGFTAATHGGVLYSLDRRAGMVYEAVGARVEHPAPVGPDGPER